VKTPMAKKSSSKKILIDADVVSHFISGGEIYLLPQIFPFPLFILDKVYEELEKYRKKKTEVDNLLNQKILTLLPFPESNQIVRKEYLYLKNKEFRGAGESACMALARHSEDIIGSSNLKDIADYCKRYNITYFTTLDFIDYAFQTGLINEERANLFISKLHQAKHRIPKNINCIGDIKPKDFLI
jgi:predicted nucleic acid-binding protein